MNHVFVHFNLLLVFNASKLRSHLHRSEIFRAGELGFFYSIAEETLTCGDLELLFFKVNNALSEVTKEEKVKIVEWITCFEKIASNNVFLVFHFIRQL
jgi:hypothetical protein